MTPTLPLTEASEAAVPAEKGGEATASAMEGATAQTTGAESGASSSLCSALPSKLLLGRMSYCTHPYLRDERMCAVCGEIAPELGKTTGTTRVFVRGGHHVSVSRTEAQSLYRSMAEKLTKSKRLNLILDIDLTLLHATIDPRAEIIKEEGIEVHSFDVLNQGRLLRHWCCLRPGLREFLQMAHELYVLTIYTHGRRDYAQKVCVFMMCVFSGRGRKWKR